MKILYFLLGIIITIVIVIFLFLNSKPFGKLPDGERLEKIKLSKNYINDKFENQIPTVVGNSDESMFRKLRVLVRALYNLTKKDEIKNTTPNFNLPTQKTNLKNLPKDENIAVWFGHSTIFLQLDGKRILVDPVFGSYGSPFPINNAFPGTKIYTADDIPELDLLIITHDHWDHLDYTSVKSIKDKVKKVITPLGVGSHLEYWGYDKNIIDEVDWYEDKKLDDILVHILPARHFSGRGFTRDKTLWASFLLETKNLKIYLSGDSGYGPHFKEIGENFGRIDFAFMESGQYNERWASIHSLPEHMFQASQDMNTKNYIPIHFSKFKLANHTWNDPVVRLSQLTENSNIKLLTPMIGEKIYFEKENNFTKWWSDTEK